MFPEYVIFVVPQIFSISQYTEDDYWVTFRKDGGTVLNPSTGNSFDFIKASGVYLINMLVPKSLVTKDKNNNSVVGRPGPA